MIYNKVIGTFLAGAIVQIHIYRPSALMFMCWLHFKGTVSLDRYCFGRSKYFNQYFLWMRWWFSRSFKSFCYPSHLLNFCMLLWNYLLILKMLPETLLRILTSVIGLCSLVPTSHWLQGKCARMNPSHPASGMTLQNHRRLLVNIFSVKIAALGSLKRVSVRIFKNRN
jgi:hypothetical protein